MTTVTLQAAIDGPRGFPPQTRPVSRRTQNPRVASPGIGWVDALRWGLAQRTVFMTVLFAFSLPISPLSLAQTKTYPQRLLSADAVVTEILAELGVANRLVAIDAASELKEGASLPRLGYHRALAAEGLIALQPDLLIGSEQMGPPHTLDALRRARVRTLVLPYPGDISTLENNIRQIAEAVGADNSAAVLAQLQDQAESLSEQALTNTRVAFLLRGEGGTLRMAGQGTGGGGFVALTGAVNVAEYRGYRSITAEGLLELEPELLLLADTEGRGSADFLERYPVMRFSHAVRAGQLYTVDSNTLVAGISLAAVSEASRVLTTVRQALAANP